RGIAVNRPRAVVFEERRREIAGRLRPPIATQPRLDVRLQLVERYAHALAMRVTHTVVAADQGGDRDALRRGERRVPSGPMLHRRGGLSTGVLRLTGGLVANELFSGDWMLPVGEPREVLLTNLAGEAPPVRELSVPLATNQFAFAVVVLAR